MRTRMKTKKITLKIINNSKQKYPYKTMTTVIKDKTLLLKRLALVCNIEKLNISIDFENETILLEENKNERNT